MRTVLTAAISIFHHRVLLGASSALCVLNVILAFLLGHFSGLSLEFPRAEIMLVCVGAAIQIWIFRNALFFDTDRRTFAQIPRPALFLGSHHFESFYPVTVRQYIVRPTTTAKVFVVLVAAIYLVRSLGLSYLPILLVALSLAFSYSRTHFYIPLLLSVVVLIVTSLRILPADSFGQVAVMVVAFAELIGFTAIYRRLWEEFLGTRQPMPTKSAVATLGILASAVILGYLVFRPDIPPDQSRKLSEAPRPAWKLAFDAPVFTTADRPSGSSAGEGRKGPGGGALKKKSSSSDRSAAIPGLGLSPPSLQGDEVEMSEQPPLPQEETKVVTVPWWAIPVLLVLVFLLVRWLSRRRRKMPDDTEVSMVPELTAAKVKRAQKRFDLKVRMYRGAAQSQADRLAQVLHLYNLLLEHRAHCGMAKPLPATPDEYALMLTSTNSNHNLAIRYVTSTFVRAKYRNTPPTSADFERFVQAVRLLGVA